MKSYEQRRQELSDWLMDIRMDHRESLPHTFHWAIVDKMLELSNQGLPIKVPKKYRKLSAAFRFGRKQSLEGKPPLTREYFANEGAFLAYSTAYQIVNERHITITGAGAFNDKQIDEG